MRENELPRDLRVRGGALSGDQLVAGAGGCCFCSFFVGFFFCTASLGPNTYGLYRNLITTNVVTSSPKRGGIYFVGPIIDFIEYPANAVTIEFSSYSGATSGPISTRTGRDKTLVGRSDDADELESSSMSGGQSVVISAAFQFKLMEDKLFEVYKKFGEMANAQQWYELQGNNIIGNMANSFAPSDFWLNRYNVSWHMQRALTEFLAQEGFANVTMFSMMKVDFNTNYEDSITQVQVKEQMVDVQQKRQEVTMVEQQIQVMQSNYTAKITNITANGTAESLKIKAKARMDAFGLRQAAKVAKYTELKEELTLSSDEMSTYFKIKALQAQGQNVESNVVVGMKNPEL